MKFNKYIIVVCILYSSILWGTTKVHYAGFAYSGNFADVAKNYPITSALFPPNSIQQNQFDKILYDYFSQAPEFLNFRLVFGSEKGELISFAVVLNREDITYETMNDGIKTIYNISCTIFVLDYEEMNIIQSFPLSISYIDITPQKPTQSQLRSVVHKLLTQNILDKIEISRNLMSLKSSQSLSMKVANVYFADKVVSQLGTYEDSPFVYARILAQKLTESLAYELGITMLPYAKDYLGQKMSLCFSDALVQNFTIPTASYDIDITVSKLIKKPYKETKAERVDIYGSYLNLRVYDAELETEYWSQEIKAGAPKLISHGQKIEDDFNCFNEILLLGLSREVIEAMRNDKNLNKGVLNKCKNK